MDKNDSHTFETVGQKTGDIKVYVSYRIIELFSANLYSSPSKAFEELVSNSYDAFANKVAVYIASDKTRPDSILWVCDNGESMDSEGLKWLWKIGQTDKRLPDYDYKDRPPIGKFGIGKLATYVLAKKLTYICKRDGTYRAVTMDFNKIESSVEEPSKTTELFLDERTLTEEEAKRALDSLIKINGTSSLNFELWGPNAEKSWTFVIMSDLKPKASEIQEGRLRWVLRTALPLSPNFNLFFNGEKLESSKVDTPTWKKWIIGENDTVVDKFGYSAGKFDDKPCVNLPNISNIFGEIELYRDSLVRGKSGFWGRSHGIFLIVRGRLINLDDSLIGMAAMTHGVFNRVRIIVHADELDYHLTSTRESIDQSDALSDLKRYIQRKFEEVKKHYFDQLEEKERERDATYKISRAPSSLSRRPLLVVAKKFFSGEIGDLFLIDIPKNLSKKIQESCLIDLERDLTSPEGVIREVVWEVISPGAPVAKFDLITRKLRVNLIHPFFANFSEEVTSLLPFQLVAITEVLTEAFLVETGINQEKIFEIMWRRDQLLRDLTFNEKPNAPFVSQMIQASLSDSGGLEDAVFSAFDSLGFVTTKLGGKGKPDGTAVAFLGVRESVKKREDGVRERVKKREDYSIVYDAKSTSKGRIKASDARISAIARHREDYKADYTVIVAIDFEGADDKDSAISKEAKSHKVSLIRAKDLATLTLIASPKQLSWLDFRDLFENCHTVIETSKWVDKAKEREVKPGPIKELLETAYELAKTDIEPPELGAMRMRNEELKKYSKEELRTLVESLRRLVPSLISLQGDIVSLQVTPDKIISALNKVVQTNIPPDLVEAYLKVFKT